MKFFLNIKVSQVLVQLLFAQGLGNEDWDPSILHSFVVQLNQY